MQSNRFNLVLALVLALLAMAVAQTCHSHASSDGMGGCVCDTGFVGDGTDTCGIAHTAGVELAGSGTTGAIITLPVPTGATFINLTAISSVNTDVQLFQTDGTAQGTLIDTTQSGPWSITNAAGSIYFLVADGASAGEYFLTFSYFSSSDLINDGLVVETYASCVGLDNLAATEYGFATAPEVSAVDIEWLAGSYQIDFTVTAPYERDMAIVLVDTSDFDALSGDIRQRPSGSCSARPALSSEVPFNALFQSAPTATATAAMGGDFLAYADPTTTGWDMTASDCATVSYHRTFSLSELGACNNVTFATGTDPSTNASLISYSGSIYIHTLQPGEDSGTDESAGYAKFTQEFPFEVQIATEFEGLVLASSDLTTIHVVIRYLRLEGGDMVMQLETQVEAQGISTPVIQLQDGSTASITPDAMASDANPCLSNSETDICVQRWVYRKSSWTNTDNQAYNFIWTVYSSTSHVLTVPISLNLRVNSVNVVVGKLGDLSLNLYADQTDAQAGNGNTKTTQYPWHVNERIFLRGDVALNPSDVSAFTISYRELWVCYSSTIGYSITLDNGGCTDPNLSDDERVHLIANGAVQSGLTTSAFRTSADSVSNGGSTVAAGASFDAFPLTGEPHVYTIHAKVLLQSNGRKREVNALIRRDAKSPSTTANFVIIPDANNNNSHSSSILDNWLMVSLGGVGVIAAAALVVVGALIVRKRQQASGLTVAVPTIQV